MKILTDEISMYVCIMYVYTQIYVCIHIHTYTSLSKFSLKDMGIFAWIHAD